MSSIAKTIFDFSVKDGKGADMPLDKYRGKVLLIMNVASKCGFTKGGYDAANTLLRKHREKGFDVLAFPCNQFANQEPGDAVSIQKFACEIMKAEFDILGKVDVNGSNTSPLWEFLKNSVPGILGTTAIKWNFTMFLCDRSGIPKYRYSPGTSADAIEKDVEKLL